MKMEAELFVHGVPYGKCFWGNDKNEETYLSTFYDSSSDEIKFLVRVRSLNGRLYCYYHYLKYKDILDSGGRSGSYFGICLRLDACCQDVLNMYRILDYIYNVRVKGQLLIVRGNKLQYVAPDFEKTSEALKGIAQEAYNLVLSTFSKDKFSVMAGFASYGSKVPAYNFYECSNDDLLTMLRQYGCVALSPFYPSAREKELQQQCDKKVQAIQREYDDKLRADLETRDKEKREIEAMRLSAEQMLKQNEDSIRQKDKEINVLKSEVEQLRTRDMKQTKHFAQLLAPIRKAIEELPVASPEEVAGNSHDRSKRKIIKQIKKWLLFVNFILLVVILLLLLAFFPLEKPTETKPQDADLGEILVEDRRIEMPQNSDSDNSSNEEIWASRENVPNEETATLPYEDGKIDIKEYNDKGKLHIDSIYTATAVGANAGGIWSLVGATEEKGQKTSSIKFRVTGSKVELCYEDKENKIWSRELEAE